MKNKLNIYLSALYLLFPLSIVATTLPHNSNTESSSMQPPKYKCISTLPARDKWSSNQSLAFNPFDKKILAAGEYNKIRLWNTNTQKEITILEVHSGGHVNSLVFHPKQPNLLASGDSEGTIRVWDISNFKQPSIVAMLKGHTDKVTSLAFQSKQPYLLASGSEDKTIKLWNVGLTEKNITDIISSFTKKKELNLPLVIEQLITQYTFPPEIITLKRHTDVVNSVAFHPDQPNRLVSAGMDGTIRLWDVNEQKETATLGNTHAVNSLAFQPKEPYYLASDCYHTIKIWDIANKQEIINLKATDFVSIKDLTFHPDQPNILVSGMWDNTIKLWDIYKEKVIDTLSGHTNYIRKIVFQPKQPYLLASTSWDRTIKLWGPKEMAHKNESNNNSNSISRRRK